MKRITNISIVAALLVVSGCATKSRSISNSGYPGPYNIAEPAHRELDEFDVLGIERNQAISGRNCQSEGAQAQRVGVKKGNTILLIQSFTPTAQW